MAIAGDAAQLTVRRLVASAGVHEGGRMDDGRIIVSRATNCDVPALCAAISRAAHYHRRARHRLYKRGIGAVVVSLAHRGLHRNAYADVANLSTKWRASV